MVVTGLAVPTFLSLKLKLGVPLIETASAPTMPTKLAVPEVVAVMNESYTLLFAVRPATVIALAFTAWLIEELELSENAKLPV